jgi:two-component system, NarL family, response regulator DevR
MTEDSDRAIRVFLLEDHEVVRNGLKELLASETGIDVVGEAESASTALARLPELRPDVAVLDVRLPDGDGVLVCREIRSILPSTACLILTGYGDDWAMVGAVMAGAAGYVSKQAAAQDLVGAVRTVAAGRSCLSPEATQEIINRVRDGTSRTDPLAVLSNQEKRVLDLIGEGLTNRQIAERMVLSEKTVKNYVSSVLTKLGMHRRSQAAAMAARLSERPVAS